MRFLFCSLSDPILVGIRELVPNPGTKTGLASLRLPPVLAILPVIIPRTNRCPLFVEAALLGSVIFTLFPCAAQVTPSYRETAHANEVSIAPTDTLVGSILISLCILLRPHRRRLLYFGPLISRPGLRGARMSDCIPSQKSLSWITLGLAAHPSQDECHTRDVTAAASWLRRSAAAAQMLIADSPTTRGAAYPHTCGTHARAQVLPAPSKPAKHLPGARCK